MASEKAYDPQERVAVILTLEEWGTVQRWLSYGTDYHMAKREETLANCKNRHMAAQLVAEHEAAAAKATAVWKIIEETLIPNPAKLE